MNPFGMPPFDPSQMDPKLLLQLSQMIQQLPPDQLERMQRLMHNMMAGFDVRGEMEEFEKTLPAGFREKLMAIMGQAGPQAVPQELPKNLDVREARLTLLRAVAEGRMAPEEAERLLFH